MRISRTLALFLTLILVGPLHAKTQHALLKKLREGFSKNGIHTRLANAHTLYLQLNGKKCFISKKQPNLQIQLENGKAEMRFSIIHLPNKIKIIKNFTNGEKATAIGALPFNNSYPFSLNSIELFATETKIGAELGGIEISDSMQALKDITLTKCW